MSDTKYFLLIDERRPGIRDWQAVITEEGAKAIWQGYVNYMRGSPSQTMEQRNQRGGVAWLSEIDYWKQQGYLPAYFDWTQYEIKD